MDNKEKCIKIGALSKIVNLSARQIDYLVVTGVIGKECYTIDQKNRYRLFNEKAIQICAAYAKGKLIESLAAFSNPLNVLTGNYVEETAKKESEEFKKSVIKRLQHIQKEINELMEELKS